MNKLPTFIAIVALLIMNVVSAAHADTLGGILCDDVKIESLHDCHEQGESQSSVCDCTACGHHHHSHASLPLVKSSPFPSYTKMEIRFENINYLSQLHYPPSKPPKA